MGTPRRPGEPPPAWSARSSPARLHRAAHAGTGRAGQSGSGGHPPTARAPGHHHHSKPAVVRVSGLRAARRFRSSGGAPEVAPAGAACPRSRARLSHGLAGVELRGAVTSRDHHDRENVHRGPRRAQISSLASDAPGRPPGWSSARGCARKGPRRMRAMTRSRYNPPAMTRPFDVVTFDCYGTLVDWEAGIASAFAAATRADGVRVDRDQALDAYL